MTQQTITSLTTAYQDYLQSQQTAQYPINPYTPNSFWSIDAGAMAAILLDLYMNLQIVQNSIYPQYSTGDQCDQWLYSRGLPTRVGATYGTVQCTLTSTTPDTIAINTVFTLGTMQYQSLQSITVPDNATQFTLYAVTAGIQQTPTVDPVSILTAGTQTAQVQSVIIGTNEESDQSCINRILQAVLIPPAGARQTDYYNFCFLADPNVTGAIPFPNFLNINGVSILGLSPLVGNTTMTDYLLDLSFSAYTLYSREANSTILNNVNVYIQNQKLVGLTSYIVPCITYTLDESQTIINTGSNFIVTVSLLSPYSLSSLVTIATQNIDGTANTIKYSITELVQREVRRAICNQPFGGTIINGVNYITIDSLITAVTNQLGSINGALAQLITNITFNVTDIIVPALNAFAVDQYMNAIYDVTSYGYIQVNAI